MSRIPRIPWRKVDVSDPLKSSAGVQGTIARHPFMVWRKVDVSLSEAAGILPGSAVNRTGEVERLAAVKLGPGTECRRPTRRTASAAG